jgi:hypothetical protein
LQKSEVSFYIGYINIFPIGGKKNAVGFPLSLVHGRDGFAGYSVIIKGVDI